MRKSYMLKKIIRLCGVFAAVAFAANWTGSTSEPENMKKIDGKAFYVITTADELAWFAAQVNGGKTTINAVLDNDIVFGKDKNTVSTVNWTPIGKDASHSFAGVFDGANFVVYGLYNASANEASLFGFTNANAVVRNVKMNKFSFKATIHSAGIIAVNKGTLQDSRSEGVLTASKDSSLAGGCVARNEGKIIGCRSKVSISAVAYAGGVVAYNQGSVENSGSYSSGVQCRSYAGGIAAFNVGTLFKVESNSNVSNADIKKSILYSKNRTKTGDDRYNVEHIYKAYMGGIVGYNSGKVNIANNISTVAEPLSARPMFARRVYTVTTNSYTYSTFYGGISGLNKGSITNVVNNRTGSAGYTGGIAAVNSGNTAVIKNAINYASSMQGLVWSNESGAKVINSYYDNTINTSKAIGTQKATAENAIGKTTADMKKDQLAWVLNTANGTEKNSGIWSRGINGYPTFALGEYKAVYKVIFNDDGSTMNRYTNYKGLVTFPEDPEPAEGCVFSGWYNANDVKVKSSMVFSADQTVKAVYTDASDVFWTITFYNASSADTVLESKSYQHGSIVTYGGVTPTLASTAQYTYTFKGWDVEPTNAVEDFEYHAVYDSTIRSYTVTFNNTDGSKIESATFEYGKMPSCSKTPTRATTAEWKYSHKGWRPALDYVTEAATYTAIYDSSKVEYKVTFMNGTTVIDEQMVPYGDAAVAPANVTREGYKFTGWNTSFTKVTENLTVKALFEEIPVYIVKVVDSEGVKIDSTKVMEGKTYTLPSAPKKEDYTFDAYYNGDKKLGVAGNVISISANITITAKYTKNPKSSSSVVVSSSSAIPKSSSSSTPKSSSSVVSSSSKEIASSSSTPRNDESSSSKTVSSSSTAKSSSSVRSSSSQVKSSSSSVVKSSSSSSKKVSSSSSVKSSSSKGKSSSSKKSDAIVSKMQIPTFSLQVQARSIQISAAPINSVYAIFDMQGRVLMTGRVSTANFNIALPRAGSYLVKIGNQTRKVNIR